MLSPTPASAMSGSALTAGPPADEAGGILTVDLSALESNYKTLRSASTPAECAAVVKADGYVSSGGRAVVRATGGRFFDMGGVR